MAPAHPHATSVAVYPALLLEKPQIKGILREKSISRIWNLLFMPIYLPTKEKMKNFIKLSYIWDQSGICSSNSLEMRAI